MPPAMHTTPSRATCSSPRGAARASRALILHPPYLHLYLGGALAPALSVLASRIAACSGAWSVVCGHGSPTHPSQPLKPRRQVFCGVPLTLSDSVIPRRD